MKTVDDGYEPDSESESMKSENDIPRMNENERAIVSAFLNEVFKRSVDILKNMEETEERISPHLTAEESRFVKEFVKGVFKRAVDVMEKHANDYPPFQKEDLKLEPSVQDALMDKINVKVKKTVKNSLERELQGKEKPQTQNVKGQNISVAKTETRKMPKHENAPMNINLDSHREFITYGGKNPRGYHMLYIDPKKAPQKDDIEDHGYYLKILDSLFTLTDNFIAENTYQQPFILVYRCLGEPQSKRMRFQWMLKLYGILRDRYLDNLVNFIVCNPDIKFKAMLKVCKPFMRRELSRKLLIVTERDTN